MQVALIDLDPGPYSFPQSARSARGNLLRLYRSYLKGELRGAWRLPPTELYRFLLEYYRGDRSALRSLWAQARRHRALRAALAGRWYRRPSRRSPERESRVTS